MKRYIENEIERIAKATGYEFDFLMDIYNDTMEIDGEVNMKLFEEISMEHDW